jgi:PEGA domain-containing protein
MRARLRLSRHARMVDRGEWGTDAARRVGTTMSRVVAVVACGVLLAACSMSMPSFDFLKSGPSTEILRIESEPPGADARTSQGQTCRTPCELNVPAASELAVTVALNGYQPQTLPVRVEGGGLQPNPLYVELQPAAPPARPKAPPPAKKRTSAAAPPAPKAQAQAAAPAPAAPAPAATYPTSSFGYPWPPASQ